MLEFKSFMSRAVDADKVVAELCRSVSGFQADLIVIFVSHHHGPEFVDLLNGIRAGTEARNLIGCTGESIIGPDSEVEGAPAAALWAARMPGVRALPFYVDQEDVQRFEGESDWRERLGVAPDDRPSFILLPEPFTIDADACVRQIDAAFPGAVVAGGMASGANAAGQNRLFLNDQVLRHGMVGISLCGPVRVTSVVSQGCRPIGKPFVVTKARQNVIAELGGKPALAVLQEIFQTSEPSERKLIQSGLHLGQVVDEQLREFRQGDFLVRNLMGVVDESALAVNAIIRPGQTVQFHVRDSAIADADMKTLVSTQVSRLGSKPSGGLLFSCNGRGTRLFGRPHHDIGVVNEFAADCRVAGFFAQGEIGPVGPRTFIHGFTSSLVLFSEQPE